MGQLLNTTALNAACENIRSQMTEQRIVQRIAWVTGAGKGIGRQLALELAKDGWLVAASARTESDLNRLINDAAAFEGAVKAYPVDVTSEQQIKELIHEIEISLGEIDLAILNAGTYIRFGAAEFTVNKFYTQWNVNVMGTINCFVYIMEKMKPRKSGHVVVVSSLSAYRGIPMASGYGASKAALTNMCEALKPELEQFGIKLSVVHPGFVRTPLTSRNKFPMPFLMEVDVAARRIIKGIKKDKFEIAFPMPFAIFMKVIRRLPYPIYFAMTRRLLKQRK